MAKFITRKIRLVSHSYLSKYLAYLCDDCGRVESRVKAKCISCGNIGYKNRVIVWPKVAAFQCKTYLFNKILIKTTNISIVLAFRIKSSTVKFELPYYNDCVEEKHNADNDDLPDTYRYRLPPFGVHKCPYESNLMVYTLLQ